MHYATCNLDLYWENPIVHQCQCTDANYFNLILLILLIPFTGTQDGILVISWEWKNDKQTCRFKFPQKLCNDLSYAKMDLKSWYIDFRTVNKVKSYGSGVNKHQRLQLQSWCVKYGFRLIIDHFDCVEYLTNFPYKGKKI